MDVVGTWPCKHLFERESNKRQIGHVVERKRRGLDARNTMTVRLQCRHAGYLHEAGYG